MIYIPFILVLIACCCCCAELVLLSSIIHDSKEVGRVDYRLIDRRKICLRKTVFCVVLATVIFFFTRLFLV